MLNSKNFGVPQNRERVFIIGHLRGGSTQKIFPLSEGGGQVDGVQREELSTNTLTTRYPNSQGSGSYIVEGEQQEVKVAGNVNPSGHGFNKGGEHDIAPTLTSNSYQENNMVKTAYRIRKLTPRECWRLQGFPDWAFDKAEQVNSNSQLYKQAGNSVTVNVITEIARQLR